MLPFGASDGVMVLEERQVPPPRCQPLEVLTCWKIFSQTTIAMGTTHLSQCQAEEDFCCSDTERRLRQSP